MKVQRTFTPGSEWFYIKIYTGYKTADKILIKAIYPTLKELKKIGILEKWFFIRYSDPDFHLRIRVLTQEISNSATILNIFHEKLDPSVKKGWIWKIQLDTYNRELERYENDLIIDSESLFCVNSDIVISLIKELDKYGYESYRWMIALKLIDFSLSYFNLELENKKELLMQMSNSFKAEFGFNEFNAKQFNTKFRENRNIITSILDNTIEDKNILSLLHIVEKKSRHAKPIIQAIQAKASKGTIINLQSSYIHMMINRLFRSNNRKHELILYDFLTRYYTSKLAQIANQKKTE